MWRNPNRGGIETIIKGYQHSLYERELTFSLINNNEKYFPVPLLSIFLLLIFFLLFFYLYK